MSKFVDVTRGRVQYNALLHVHSSNGELISSLNIHINNDNNRRVTNIGDQSSDQSSTRTLHSYNSGSESAIVRAFGGMEALFAQSTEHIRFEHKLLVWEFRPRARLRTQVGHSVYSRVLICLLFTSARSFR